MTANNSSNPSWWHTVPGILTAVAAIISAVTGLIIALHQIRSAEVDQASSNQRSPATQSSDSRTTQALSLAAKTFIIAPQHISARGHLESRSPRVCIGSEIEDINWRNLLRAYGLSDAIAVWSPSLTFYEEHMTNGTCLLTLYSSEQAGAANTLIAWLDQYGDDPPYRVEAFRDLFQDWEVGS